MGLYGVTRCYIRSRLCGVSIGINLVSVVLYERLVVSRE